MMAERRTVHITDDLDERAVDYLDRQPDHTVNYSKLVRAALEEYLDEHEDNAEQEAPADD